MWYRHDRAKFRRLLRESRALSRRIEKNWDRLAAEYRAALFAGYESVRPLDPADHTAFPAMLLARGLTYLGWAADRRGEPTAEWHAVTVLPHVVQLARELVQ